ncbi:MAG: transposase [Myxococcales bacterium]|nr:transposase [Myxococcales bacterium]
MRPKLRAAWIQTIGSGCRKSGPKTEQLALSALVGAAATGLGLAGERAGKPLLRVVDPEKARIAERVGESLGVNVHAEVAVPARDRARLERLCRYVCRPPIAQERLVEVAGGKLRYLLKRPWSDGTVALVLEPLDLCARIAALIPPPRWRLRFAPSDLACTPSSLLDSVHAVPHDPLPRRAQLTCEAPVRGRAEGGRQGTEAARALRA